MLWDHRVTLYRIEARSQCPDAVGNPLSDEYRREIKCAARAPEPSSDWGIPSESLALWRVHNVLPDELSPAASSTSAKSRLMATNCVLACRSFFRMAAAISCEVMP